MSDAQACGNPHCQHRRDLHCTKCGKCLECENCGGFVGS